MFSTNFLNINILQLFNLLGFTRLALIETLLKHRKDILKQCSVVDDKKSSLYASDLSMLCIIHLDFIESLLSDLFKLGMEKRPRHMEMITIETEEDRLLRKELRKEEKAYQRMNRRHDSDSDDESIKLVSKTLVKI